MLGRLNVSCTMSLYHEPGERGIPQMEKLSESRTSLRTLSSAPAGAQIINIYLCYALASWQTTGFE